MQCKCRCWVQADFEHQVKLERQHNTELQRQNEQATQAKVSLQAPLFVHEHMTGYAYVQAPGAHAEWVQLFLKICHHTSWRLHAFVWAAAAASAQHKAAFIEHAISDLDIRDQSTVAAM